MAMDMVDNKPMRKRGVLYLIGERILERRQIRKGGHAKRKLGRAVCVVKNIAKIK